MPPTQDDDARAGRVVEPGQLALNLQGEFAGRRDDQGERLGRAARSSLGVAEQGRTRSRARRRRSCPSRSGPRRAGRGPAPRARGRRPGRASARHSRARRGRGRARDESQEKPWLPASASRCGRAPRIEGFSVAQGGAAPAFGPARPSRPVESAGGRRRSRTRPTGAGPRPPARRFNRGASEGRPERSSRLSTPSSSSSWCRRRRPSSASSRTCSRRCRSW